LRILASASRPGAGRYDSKSVHRIFTCFAKLAEYNPPIPLLRGPLHLAEVGRSKRKSPVSVLVVEADCLTAELLSVALKRCQNLFDIVGRTVSFGDTLKAVDEMGPRVALISADLREGQGAGFRLMSQIRERFPKTAIVALLKDPRQEQVLAAFRAGARGVISRDQPFRVLARCIRRVDEGEIWASPDQIGLVFDTLNQASVLLLPHESQSVFAELTPREREVAAPVMDGLRNSEIGVRLGVSEHTVRNYLMKIYDKLGVSNRVQLTRHGVDALHPRTHLDPGVRI